IACAVRRRTAPAAWRVPAAAPAHPSPAGRACRGARSVESRQGAAPRPQRRAMSFPLACRLPRRRRRAPPAAVLAWNQKFEIRNSEIRRRLVLLHLFQESLDAFDVLLGKVQREVQLRQASQLQALYQLAPNEARSV